MTMLTICLAKRKLKIKKISGTILTKMIIITKASLSLTTTVFPQSNKYSSSSPFSRINDLLSLSSSLTINTI